ncbi:hypothetical protein AHAS_Ahas16G0249200 [Arachis hypogaea]
MEYFFHTWFSLIHQHQPAAIIFSDAGPDTRWVGNELGLGASTYMRPREIRLVMSGYLPSVMSQSDLSVGRNCHLLLNVPPNSSGLISPEDIQVLQEFTELRRSIFSNNFDINELLQASSTRGEGGGGGGGTCDSQFSPYNVLKEGIYTYWALEEYQSRWILYIDLQELVSFNVLQLQEPIQMGQRVSEFHLEELQQDGLWKIVTNGTTIGYQRLLLFPKVKSQHLKLVIDKSRADPLISYFGIYMDPVTIWISIYDDTVLTSHFNATQVIHIITQDNFHTATSTATIWFQHAAQTFVKIPFFGAVSYLTFAVTPFCIVFAVIWAVYHRVSFAWIGQDILGITLIITVLQIVRIPNLKVGTVLLSCAFLYDIFWVFVSKRWFHESVMIVVARGDKSGEDGIPMLLKIPCLYFLAEIEGLEQKSDSEVEKGLLMLLDSDLPALKVDFLELQNSKWRDSNCVGK